MFTIFYVLFLDFCLHLFLNSKVDANQSFVSVTDNNSPAYLNLPIVLNFMEQCLPTGTTHKAWVLNKNTQLKNQMKTIYNQTIVSCFYECFQTKDCVAITRDNRQNDKFGTCWLFDDIHIKETMEQFHSYIQTNCLFIKNDKRLSTQTFPIVFNPEAECTIESLQTIEMNTCNYKTWFILENTEMTILSYRNLTNKDILDCLIECFNDRLCKAIVVEDIVPFELICHFYNESYNKNSNNIRKNGRKNLYSIICCEIKLTTVSKSTNLTMSYWPSDECTIGSSNNNNKNCGFNLWKIKEGIRIKGGLFIATELTTLQECLNACLQSVSCVAVSVDYYERRCLLLNSISYKLVGQSKWITYILHCCQNFQQSVEIVKLLNNNNNIHGLNKMKSLKLIDLMIIAFIICNTLIVIYYIFRLKWTEVKKNSFFKTITINFCSASLIYLYYNELS